MGGSAPLADRETEFLRMRSPRVFAAGAILGLAVGFISAGFVLSMTGQASDPASAARPSGGRGPDGPPGRGGMLPAITTASVAPASVGRSIAAVGSGRAAKSVTLVAEATGLVEAVTAKAGQQVKAGDVILKLDDAEQKIALARARAQYPIAKANAARYADLYKDDSASKLEVDNAFNAFKAAEADLKNADYSLKQRTILAPFDGVVGLIGIEAGDYLRAGEVVATMDDLSSLIIEFAIPQEAAAGVKIGQAVEATLAGDAGEKIAGSISAIDSRVDPASRTLKIEAIFTNAQGNLLPGATYAVTTTNDGASALSAPGLAIQWDRTGAYVWKLGTDGSASRVSVRVLQRRDELAIIDGDVAAGDLVIVEGADRVRPGMMFPQVSAGPPGPAGALSAGAN
jgi:RND family efflux transporter MFP subunit